MLISRGELWRRQYRANRYARHLSRPELNKRLHDIIMNMITLSPKAKIGLLEMDKTGKEWMEKCTHAFEEMELRYGPFPNGFAVDTFESGSLPNFASELSKRAVEKMSALNLRQGQAFLKLGQKIHMESLYAAGKLRLQPASFFSAPELNQAVQDDEMSLPLSFMLTREQILSLVANPKEVPAILTEQRLDVQFTSTADFWLYCVTQSIKPRLVVDFNAEACVIIKNKMEFTRRLVAGARDALGKCEFHDGPVNYVDPLLPRTHKIFVPRSKPFSYTYQDEYRFCWLPNPAVHRLGHVDIEIGPLCDIADLIVI